MLDVTKEEFGSKKKNKKNIFIVIFVIQYF